MGECTSTRPCGINTSGRPPLTHSTSVPARPRRPSAGRNLGLRSSESAPTPCSDEVCRTWAATACAPRETEIHRLPLSLGSGDVRSLCVCVSVSLRGSRMIRSCICSISPPVWPTRSHDTTLPESFSSNRPSRGPPSDRSTYPRGEASPTHPFRPSAPRTGSAP